MAVDIAGLVSIIIFYIVILAVGIWSGRKSAKSNSAAEVFLADRNMSLFIACFTLTATMVGGAFINGTAEMMATSGLIWTQAPIGYCIGMFIGGIVFAPKMRKAGYVTMFDPFQEVYGIRIGALMCIPQFMGDIFWTAAVLAALGATIHIIMDMDQTLSIIISAVIAVAYTFLGGLWSVAYTDVIQLACIAIGLVIAFPFALVSPAVDMAKLDDNWVGEIATEDIGRWLDLVGVVALGGIPWQSYFQRILACRSWEQARMASCIAAVMCLSLAIPPAILGIAGRAADWNATDYDGPLPLTAAEYSYVLPLALQYLCPAAVSVIGIGMMSAASMSSADSSILASATVFTNNMYKNAIRIYASDRELVWVLRGAILVVGVLSTLIAVTVHSIYGLYVMCSDLMYVVLFPQFTSILFIPKTNPYGGLTGFFISLGLRIFSGDSLIGLPPVIKFPFYDEAKGQGFPFRTLAMLSGFAAIIGVSRLTDAAYHRRWCSQSWDFLGFFSRTEVPRLHGHKDFGVKKSKVKTLSENVDHVKDATDAELAGFTNTDNKSREVIGDNWNPLDEQRNKESGNRAPFRRNGAHLGEGDEMASEPLQTKDGTENSVNT